MVVTGEEADQAGRDAGDLEVVAQRRRERQRADPGDVDLGLGTGTDDVEPLGDEVGAVRRPHPERVTGLVGQRRSARVDDELADLLGAAGPAEQPVAGEAGEQRRGAGRHRAVAARLERPAAATRCAARAPAGGAGPGRSRRASAARVGRKSGSQSTPRQQPRRTELGEALVESSAVAAEVGVASGRRGRARRSGPGPGPARRRPPAPARTRRRCRGVRRTRTCS